MMTPLAIVATVKKMTHRRGVLARLFVAGLVVAAAAALQACTNGDDDDSSRSADGGSDGSTSASSGSDGSRPSEFCQRWAKQCPNDVDEDLSVAKCQQKCEVDGDRGEKCAWVYCSVESGKCDNEEPHDKSIEACVKENGW